jgi:syntaxin 7
MSFLDVANNNTSSYSQMTERSDVGVGEGGRYTLQSRVFQFTTSVTRFQKQVALLGTRRDTQDQRLKINALGKSIKELAKEISQTLKTSAEAQTNTKLVQDFQQVLKEYQRVYRTCLDKMSNTMPQVDSNSNARGRRRNRGGNGNGVMQRDGMRDDGQELVEAERMESQLLLDNQIDHHDVLISEREDGIREIQGQIAEVGEIFQDLAVLVNEQGDMVDDIEANIISTSGHTNEANKQLVKAAKHQKSARKQLCLLSFILIVVLVVIVMVLN